MFPHEIVLASPFDLDDHITWLMQRQRFEEALEDAERNQALLSSHKLLDIGQKYLNYLVGIGEVDKAAEKFPKILNYDKTLWESWVYVFSSKHYLKSISKYLPISNPRLDSAVYELVLDEFLKHDHEQFLRTIEKWPSDLYDVNKVIDKINIRLNIDMGSPLLLEALAKLYTYVQKFDETLSIYLQLQKGDVFGLIQQHNLFSTIFDKVTQLLHFDEQRALTLLLANTHLISFSIVVSQLQSNGERLLLHKYLHALFLKDSRFARSYHNLQVELYAVFDRDYLSRFLRQSIDYSLDHALEVCKAHSYTEETVFILGRMGCSKEALKLIIENLGSVTKAIEFVSSQNDEELWKDLIEASMNKEDFIFALLENIGGYVDPIHLIRKIPKGKPIPGLRDRLVKIISDYNLEMSLREVCNEILKDDSMQLIKQYLEVQKKAVKINSDAQCALCNESVINQNQGNYVIFFCQHIYHSKCISPSKTASSVSSQDCAVPLAGKNKLHCAVCKKKRRSEYSIHRPSPIP